MVESEDQEMQRPNRLLCEMWLTSLVVYYPRISVSGRPASAVIFKFSQVPAHACVFFFTQWLGNGINISSVRLLTTRF